MPVSYTHLITVNDPAAQVPLVYIDDVAAAFVRALEGAALPDEEGRYAVKPEYRITVGDLAAMLGRFRDMRDRLECPDQSDPLTAKLYATYLSFLPPEDFARPTVCLLYTSELTLLTACCTSLRRRVLRCAS